MKLGCTCPCPVSQSPIWVPQSRLTAWGAWNLGRGWRSALRCLAGSPSRRALRPNTPSARTDVPPLTPPNVRPPLSPCTVLQRGGSPAVLRLLQCLPGLGAAARMREGKSRSVSHTRLSCRLDIRYGIPVSQDSPGSESNSLVSPVHTHMAGTLDAWVSNRTGNVHGPPLHYLIHESPLHSLQRRRWALEE